MKGLKKKKFWHSTIGVVLVLTVTALAVAVFLKPNFFNFFKRQTFPEKAYEAFNNGKFGDAEKILKEAAQKNPNDCTVQLYLANVYLEEGYVNKEASPDIAAARKILSDLAQKGRCQNERADVLLGYSYELEGNLEKAETYYGNALAKNNNSSDALFHEGHVSWLKGDTEKAQDYYAKAEKNLTDQDSKGVKGKVYTAMGNLYATNREDSAKAINYFQKALEFTDAKNLKAEIYYDLSTLYFYQDVNFPESVQNGLKAIENNPYNELGYLACARVKISELSLIKDKSQIKKEDLERINEYLQRATDLNPQRALTQYWFGQFIFTLGNTQEALKRYGIAIALADKDNSLGQIEKNFFKSEVYFGEGMVYLSLNQKEDAKKSFNQAFAYNPVRTSFMLEAMK